MYNPNMEFQVYKTSELTEELKYTFNHIWSAAREKEEDIFEKVDATSKDLYFYLFAESVKEHVAVGRYRYVTGIKIGSKPWKTPVWGMASISTHPKYQRKGYGKELVVKMSEYALKHNMWVIGLHGKKGTLSEFYKKCGLEVDNKIGLKLYYTKDGDLVQHHKVAVSYFNGDPFIAAVKETKENVYLPYSW